MMIILIVSNHRRILLRRGRSAHSACAVLFAAHCVASLYGQRAVNPAATRAAAAAHPALSAVSSLVYIFMGALALAFLESSSPAFLADEIALAIALGTW
jgi:hypothetical protein